MLNNCKKYFDHNAIPLEDRQFTLVFTYYTTNRIKDEFYVLTLPYLRDERVMQALTDFASRTALGCGDASLFTMVSRMEDWLATTVQDVDMSDECVVASSAHMY